MSLEILESDDADMRRTFDIVSDAFEHNHPYIEYVFPAHETEEGRVVGGSRMAGMKNSDPNTKFLKVVDHTTGDIVAIAKWNIYRNVIPEEVELDGDYWETPEKKELAKAVFKGYVAKRRRAIRDSGGNLLSLDLLTVDPKFQRRGAGRMLVKWGTAIADEMGVPAVVEASNEGKGLYESEGFLVEDYVVVQYPDSWSHLDKYQKFHWMVRPARPKA